MEIAVIIGDRRDVWYLELFKLTQPRHHLTNSNSAEDLIYQMTKNEFRPDLVLYDVEEYDGTTWTGETRTLAQKVKLRVVAVSPRYTTQEAIAALTDGCCVDYMDKNIVFEPEKFLDEIQSAYKRGIPRY